MNMKVLVFLNVHLMCGVVICSESNLPQSPAAEIPPLPSVHSSICPIEVISKGNTPKEGYLTTIALNCVKKL